MRYKFRGKEIDTGKWVYGGLFKEPAPPQCFEKTLEDKYWIVYPNPRYMPDWNLPYQMVRTDVDKNTIGQYTGLKDKNGKEIYEGDIVTGTDYPFIDEGKQNYVGIVVFYDDVASFGYVYKCVRKDKRGISNGINNEFEANENLICDDLEVIGNIYDNPELLEEGE